MPGIHRVLAGGRCNSPAPQTACAYELVRVPQSKTISTFMHASRRLDMKAWKTNVRLIALMALACCLITLGSGSAQAQTVTVSPTDLSFGVPTGTLSPFTSAPQTVFVNITGSGSVTFSSVASTAPGTMPGDFAITGNSCTGTITAPNTCQVSVTFTASLAPASTLETATLSIASNVSAGPVTVPMNGAYGAIELFASLNINPSLFSGTTWENTPPTAGEAVKTTTINLSCPASPAAILSSTPDGLSNVFQDNTIQTTNTYQTTSDEEPTTTTALTTNVCYGGDLNFDNFPFPAGTSNCFQPSYESAATNYLTQNPDLAISPISEGAPGSFVATYGVQPLNLMDALLPGSESPLYAPILVQGNQSLNVQLVDAGGDLGAATLQLVTNCMPAGITPGGSITGNPITPGNISSQTQTFSFENSPGQNVGFTSSVAVAVENGLVIPSGTTPIATDIGIPQQLFSQLVANTSAGPAVCLRLTSEVDSFNQPMCKGFLLQCEAPNDGSISGNNCVPTLSAARNLFASAQFDSPDAPPNTNFLGSACSFYLTGMLVSGDTCLPASPPNSLTGPGLLLGSDGWTCVASATNLTTCTPAVANTTTAASPATYSSANCSLTGSLTGNLCPLDTLTQFLGGADPLHGSTTPGTNSIYVPVVNMPLPVTQTTITGRNGAGWVKSAPVGVGFVSNQASYSPTSTNPVANNFTPAPPYSVTYGVSPALDSHGNPIVLDTTYPISTDTTLYNSNTNINFGNASPGSPLCTIGTTPNPFTPSASLSATEGIYNLHYFTTDCALTEELLFTPTSAQVMSPTANWASFEIASFGFDNVAPTLTCATAPSSIVGTNGWYKSTVTVNCNATDDFSGFASPSDTTVANTTPPVTQGPLMTSLTPVSTGATQGTVTIPPQTISDLAGNPATVAGSTVYIDSIAPTITAAFSPSGSTFTVGQTVTLKYTCGDAGSGLATCGGQAATPSCPAAPAAGPSSSTPTISIDTTPGSAGPHTINTSAVDCAGNSTNLVVNYNVVFGAADLLVATAVPSSVKTGTNLTYKIWVLDLGPNTADNVVVSTPVPAGTTYYSAIAGTVSCNLVTGCADITTGTTCAVASGIVKCTVPTVKPVVNITGFEVKLVVTVTALKGAVITDTATVTESNPHPIAINDPSTVSTKVTN